MMGWENLTSEVLEEFACSGSQTRNTRAQEEAAWIAILGEREEVSRVKEREWHRRDRERVSRLNETVEHWCECPRCGMQFVTIGRARRGRRRVYCTDMCAIAAAAKAYRERS